MAYTSIWKYLHESNLNGYSLIIPSVAVGNVGQLACDLLISSLNMVKIASVYSTALIPIIGYDPYNMKSSTMSSCCEIYKSDDRQIIVLQLRAPLVYKNARRFLEEVIQKFKEKNIADVIILTSSFAHEKKHISSSSFRYVVNELSPYKPKMKTLNWIEHESDGTGLKIYGGGFASLLYDVVMQQSLPCFILYKYSSEGNNIPDAYEMIHYLANLIPIFSDKKDVLTQLVQPASWKLLYGRPPPIDIY